MTLWLHCVDVWSRPGRFMWERYCWQTGRPIHMLHMMDISKKRIRALSVEVSGAKPVSSREEGNPVDGCTPCSDLNKLITYEIVEICCNRRVRWSYGHPFGRSVPDALEAQQELSRIVHGGVTTVMGNTVSAHIGSDVPRPWTYKTSTIMRHQCATSSMWRCPRSRNSGLQSSCNSQCFDCVTHGA